MAALFVPLAAFAVPSIKVSVTHTLDIARPGEVISVPISEIRKQIPGLLFEHIAVRDAATGQLIPSQITNFNPEQRPAKYDDLLFQHDFKAGEKSAEFIIEQSADPVPPFPSRVFARHVPERLDDFAFENDRIGHRMYGPALASPEAGKGLLVSSGIDVWAKRVPYLIIDRWYLKGHDAYHTDSGEGLDLYDMGNARGCGGTGIWDGGHLYISHNWKTARVIANGPLRAIFELSYDSWDAAGTYVSEVKRITVDAGRNFHRVESTFTFNGRKPVTVAIGIGKHANAPASLTAAPDKSWLSHWETFPKDGSLGIAVILPKGTPAQGITENSQNHLVLTEAKSGQAVPYYIGAGWDRSGQFKDKADWEAYLTAFVARLGDPVKVSILP
jgi:hypothetical protein